MYRAVLSLWLLAVVRTVTASEFPERECCDLEYPTPTSPTSIGTTPTGLPGPQNTKTALAILNCLLARQLCINDSTCSSLLEVIPKVCGPELVACSTVTVTKCQAALRMLQSYQFFTPTCLCREPHVDPECNSFRDFLFDHPCAFVHKKERDPNFEEAVPTCHYALSVCQQSRKCMKLYEDFKLSCKMRDSKCRMEDRDSCLESWVNLRHTPVFGCICSTTENRRCDRIYNNINNNPCIEETLITGLQYPELDNIVKVISAPENASASFDYGVGNSIVENPLVDAAVGPDAHADYDHISVSVLLKNKGKATTNFTVFHEDQEGLVTAQHQKYPNSNDHGQGESKEITRFIFQSTCHLAMDNCNNNYKCRVSLAPILHHCDMSRCNRNSCMEALQSFYRKPGLPWNMEIAFCLCKKTDNKQDACLVAQERLHPVCAQRMDAPTQPTCLSLADSCRESKECRSRLELYEQNCAVDSVTRKCAGSPGECRKAMLGILGTDLRTSCVCKVESQKDFHAKRAAEQAMRSTTTTTSTTTTERNVIPLRHATLMTATEASLQTRENTVEHIPAPPPLILTTTTTTTTTTIPSTTVPPKYCVVQRPQFPDQYIKEGTFKRIYHEEECSDVCECQIGEKLTCKTVCIDRMPCKTELAYYDHAAPAYQAYRGRCLCYSGRFICIKPSVGDYNLPQGVFLFLGYSEVDERELNKNLTRVVVRDIVKTLQELVLKEAVNGTLCSLQLFNSTKENVIIAAKLNEEVDYAMLSPTESLAKEREECVEYLEAISERINSRHPDYTSHLLLSIFKMAEVDVVQVEPNSSSLSLPATKHFLLIIALFINVITRKLS